MSPANVSKLLKIIAEHYNHFKFTEDKVDAWYMALQDLEDMEVYSAYQRLRRKGGEFPPNVGQIEAEVLKSKNLESAQSAEITWADLWANKGTTDPIAQEAWQKWGGQARWGRMPDIKYDNSPKAQQTIAFARKEYIELYTRLSERKESQGNRQLGHEQSKNLLKQLDLEGLFK